MPASRLLGQAVGQQGGQGAFALFGRCRQAHAGRPTRDARDRPRGRGSASSRPPRPRPGRRRPAGRRAPPGRWSAAAPPSWPRAPACRCRATAGPWACSAARAARRRSRRTESRTGQSSQRGERAVHTSAPSSMTAMFQLLASAVPAVSPGPKAGSSRAASASLRGVLVLFGQRLAADQPGVDPADVGVHHHGGDSEGEAGDRRGRVGADAGQCEQLLLGTRDLLRRARR